MILMSVSRLLIVSSLSLLLTLFLAHIPRMFVLETVKALNVLGKGDSLEPIFFENDGTDARPVRAWRCYFRDSRKSRCLFFFSPPMRAQFVSLRHPTPWLGACDRVRKVDLSVKPRGLGFDLHLIRVHIRF